MQQDKISIDLKLPTKWEDLSDKQLRYVFALLAQGFTATEVKAYCLHRWACTKSFGPASFFSPDTLSASADAQITTAVPLTATMSIDPLAPMVS